MPRTFLGKPIPNTSRPVPRPIRGSVWRRLWLSPIVRNIGFLLIVASMGIVMASVAHAATPTASPTTTPSSSTTNDTYDPNACTTLGLDATKVSIFPLFDSSIMNPNGCNPTNWNLTVMDYLASKALYVLNWFAGVAAVCLTVYAGLLYISGFATEANVKQAKTLLVVCYTGLIIVFGARLILLGTVQFLGGTVNDTSINGTNILKN